MIPFSFDYYRPETIEEALTAYKALAEKDKAPLYYGGGSEIISMSRLNNLYTEAIIDLKGISDCAKLDNLDGFLELGATLTLKDIAESKVFDLMSKAVGRIADHTMQCKITLGGNVAGTIIYKEALLPLLLCDSSVVIASLDNPRTIPLKEAFDTRPLLAKGEFFVKFCIPSDYLSLPFIHVKRTKNEKIDYPLVTVAAIKKENSARVALSGVYNYPFRSGQFEEHLNDQSLAPTERIQKALLDLPGGILNDISGSSAYRKFVLKRILTNMLTDLEEI